MTDDNKVTLVTKGKGVIDEPFGGEGTGETGRPEQHDVELTFLVGHAAIVAPTCGTSSPASGCRAGGTVSFWGI